MEFYRVYQTTYHNNNKINNTFCGYALLDDIPHNKHYFVTWDNLEDWYSKHGDNSGLMYSCGKRGRKVEFCPREKYMRPIKEWKESKLNIEVDVVYEQFVPSLKHVIMWYDGERAIKYLTEKWANITTNK